MACWSGKQISAQASETWFRQCGNKIPAQAACIETGNTGYGAQCGGWCTAKGWDVGGGGGGGGVKQHWWMDLMQVMGHHHGSPDGYRTSPWVIR